MILCCSFSIAHFVFLAQVWPASKIGSRIVSITSLTRTNKREWKLSEKGGMCIFICYVVFAGADLAPISRHPLTSAWVRRMILLMLFYSFAVPPWHPAKTSRYVNTRKCGGDTDNSRDRFNPPLWTLSHKNTHQPDSYGFEIPRRPLTTNRCTFLRKRANELWTQTIRGIVWNSLLRNVTNRPIKIHRQGTISVSRILAWQPFSLIEHDTGKSKSTRNSLRLHKLSGT